jgi:YHS domain-containing protein
MVSTIRAANCQKWGSIPIRTVEVAAMEQAIDPVCHMTVDVASARFTTEYQGKTYYFCAPGCQKTFEADPDKYTTDD